MDRICVQCGKRYTLSESEVHFYESKNLSIPKRCKECRERNKKYGIDSTSPELWQHSDKYGSYNSYFVNNTNAKSAVASFVIMMVSAFFAGLSLFLQIGWAFVILSAVSFIFSSIIFAASFFSTKVLVEEFDTTEYMHTFYDMKSMTEHYVKHGRETHSDSMEDYLSKANKVITDKGCRTKTISNGDKLYYKPQTNEFVVIAKAGYIRTYFIANDKYYCQQ